MAVSNHLNFSRAAEQLRLTQPAVSHQINSLEDELEVKLFHRTSKRVQLTQAGHLFSQYAQEILALSHMSKDRLRESRQTSVIHFGIGCHSFLELELAKPALARLREELPLLLPMLRLVSSASLENLLEDGEVQVMFTFQENAPKRAAYRELARLQVMCICAEGHPFAGYEVLNVQQLRAGGRFAACPLHTGPHTLMELQSRIITGRAPDQTCFCDGLETMYTLVETGYAFAVSVGLPVRGLPGIRAVPVAGYAPLSFGAAFRAGEDHPALRPFLEQMERSFRPQAPAGQGQAGGPDTGEAGTDAIKGPGA